MSTISVTDLQQTSELTTHSLEPALFPHEFVGILVENAVNTLTGYLRANGGAEQAITLVSAIAALTTYSHLAQTNSDQVPFFCNDMITELVPDVTRAIVALGGVFMTQESISVPRTVSSAHV